MKTPWRLRHRVRMAWRALFPGRRLHWGDEATRDLSTWIDVERDKHGRVVAVLYRGALLPFRETTVQWEQSSALRRIYGARGLMPIMAMDLMRPEPPRLDEESNPRDVEREAVLT